MKLNNQIISRKLLVIALALLTTTLCVNLETSSHYNLRGKFIKMLKNKQNYLKKILK